MKLAILFGRWSLSFRKTLDLLTCRTDPRGLTGSELGCIRIAEELAASGHDVSLHSVTDVAGQDWNGIHVKDIDAPIESCDAVISINEPDLLRAAPSGALRVCCFWLNDTSFCKVGFDEHVDLFISPSAPHLHQMMTNAAWHKVECTAEQPNGLGVYVPDSKKWTVVGLGCDTERYAGHGAKLSGRVVSCSSPDRGLHWVLQEWPAIRKAVPHATLHIFYRLDPWLRGFDQTPYYPPIEPLRARANYVEECLRRFADAGGMGVTLRDSVSRETIEREMALAEVCAFPCDTTTWSEGFSVATLEACAAGAVPVISDCDALGEIYLGSAVVVGRSQGWVGRWRDRVIDALTDEEQRQHWSERAQRFAAKRTWENTAQLIAEEIERRQ